MTYAERRQELNNFRQQIAQLRVQMRELQSHRESEPVADYEFREGNQTAHLRDLFGDHDTLFVVHNMGKACPYCTLWADGMNGVLPHLENRAAFVLSSPDSPEIQQAFAQERGWGFRMVCHAGTSFAEDMGYTSEHGFEPGVSVFRRAGNKVLRVGDTSFGPGDDFCLVWPLFDMIPEGPDGWQPRYNFS
ncbi:MAG: DUF899 family protein [Chromatiales bacterium]|nr:MAG: DUF899 family protein [Chromatiales bacterium]